MAAVCHWHAIKRDLLTLQRSADEIDAGTLPFHELVSIVVAAPPTSSVFVAMDGWSKTDQLLANMQEQQAGLISLPHRHNRPGVSQAEASAPEFRPTEQVMNGRRVSTSKVQGFQPMAMDDWIAFRKKNYALGDAVELGKANEAAMVAERQRQAAQRATDRAAQVQLAINAQSAV